MYYLLLTAYCQLIWESSQTSIMKKLKKSIIVKQVKDFKINKGIKRTYQPVAGDVAIFKVDEIGKHSSIQGINGNNYYFENDLSTC